VPTLELRQRRGIPLDADRRGSTRQYSNPMSDDSGLVVSVPDGGIALFSGSNQRVWASVEPSGSSFYDGSMSAIGVVRPPKYIFAEPAPIHNYQITAP
jgi:hypothetical protein